MDAMGKAMRGTGEPEGDEAGEAKAEATSALQIVSGVATNGSWTNTIG